MHEENPVTFRALEVTARAFDGISKEGRGAKHLKDAPFCLPALYDLEQSCRGERQKAGEGEVQERWKWVEVGGARRRVSDFILNAAQEHKKHSSPFNIMLRAT